MSSGDDSGRAAQAPQRAHRREYQRRVNRVSDFVRLHLAENLTLERLAAIAAFSPFHFHRVFFAVSGETLQDFIGRLRLERAASALLARPDQRVIDIALAVGFASPASFARAFRKHFAMSASQWRRGGALRWQAAIDEKRKPGKAERNPGKVSSATAGHAGSTHAGAAIMEIEIKQLPPYRVAYMRRIGPYGAQGIPALWQRLRAWCSARGLAFDSLTTLGVAYDDPRVVAPERCRYDACVVVDEGFPTDRSIDFATLAGGSCAVAAFLGSAGEIEAAWERLYGNWLPASGYLPADRPCVELMRGDPWLADGSGRLRCELCLPIAAL